MTEDPNVVKVISEAVEPASPQQQGVINQYLINSDKLIKKVAICVPVRGTVQANFLGNYIGVFTFFMKQKNVIPLPIFSEGVPLDVARNALVRSAAIAGADYYFWLDSDVYVGEQQLKSMWNLLHCRDNTDKPVQVVSGIYYERDAPFNPVIRKLDQVGRFVPILEYDKDKPFQIDGMGMGCVLMKAKPMNDVVNATKGKPFQFHDRISEDLFFCEQLKVLGYPIWCDPQAQAGHYGAFVHEWHHMHYLVDEYTDVNELVKYLNQGKKRGDEGYISHRIALDLCQRAPYDINRKFKAAFPDIKKVSQEDVDRFYMESKEYIYDLTMFWVSSKSKAATLFQEIHSLIPNAKTFLDYGCGIGDYGILALENSEPNGTEKVVFFDINTENLNYLNWRLDQRKDLISKSGAKVIASNNREDMHTVPDGSRNQTYDVIFCLEVFEHLKEPEKYLAEMRGMLNRNGVLASSVGPIGPFQAQHISTLKPEEHGFIRLGEFVYVRDDSDTALKIKEHKAHITGSDIGANV